MIDDFATDDIQTGETHIFDRSKGTGPPILLLHGFPQTHLMWRHVAPLLARDFTVVCADLRGYGLSGCPASTPDHAPYAKRAMARDMVTVMEKLGFPRFAVAGHDRGARVAYRMALDHPDRVDRLAVLDILPTETTWERADAKFTLAYWPWSLLAQPEPLPERILTTNAAAIIDDALGGWGSSASTFPPVIREAYIHALREPRTPMPSARSTAPPQPSTGNTTRRIVPMAAGWPVPFAFCGAPADRWIPGTPRHPDPSRSGGRGAMMPRDSRSFAATFSRNRTLHEPPMRCSASSAPRMPVRRPTNNLANSPRPFASGGSAAPHHSPTMTRRRALPVAKIRWRLHQVTCGTAH